MEDHPHSLKAACITAADADVYHKPRRTKFEPFDCSAAFRFCLLKPSSISAIRQTRPKSHEARPALTRAAQAYSALKNSPDSKVEKMENNGERKAIKANALLIRLVRPRRGTWRTAGQAARTTAGRPKRHRVGGFHERIAPTNSAQPAQLPPRPAAWLRGPRSTGTEQCDFKFFSLGTWTSADSEKEERARSGLANGGLEEQPGGADK